MQASRTPFAGIGVGSEHGSLVSELLDRNIKLPALEDQTILRHQAPEGLYCTLLVGVVCKVYRAFLHSLGHVL